MILFLLAIASFFRFYRLQQLMPFTIDEEYVSQLAWTIVKDFHVLWIGVSAGSTNYYLGPGYVYVAALLLYISRGDPLVLGIASSLIGVATTVLLYFFTRSISSVAIARAAAFFYAASAYIAFYDRRFWPPPLGFFGIVLLWSIIRSSKHPAWLIASAALIGVSLHIHLSLLIFIPFFCAACYRALRTKRVSFPLVMATLAAYLLTTAPLLVYDFLHNADNLKAPFALLGSQSGGLIEALGMHIRMLHAILARLWDARVAANSFNAFLYNALTVAAIALLFLKKQFPALKLVGSVVAVFLTAFLFYPGRIQEYYLAGALPFMCIGMGVLLAELSKPLRAAVIIAFLLINIVALYLAVEPQSLATKLALIHEVQQSTRKQPISVLTKEDYRFNGGWHFLFMTQGTTVVGGTPEPVFGWIYQQYQTTQLKPKHTVRIEYTPKGLMYSL